MYKKLRFWIRTYFGFSYKEINGFIALILIMVLCLALPPAFDYFIPSKTADPSKDKLKFDSLVTILNALDTTGKSYNKELFSDNSPQKNIEYHLFDFNPNEITSEQWQQLGLKKYIAERIVKYRSKGGKFRKKEDLLKIYDFPKDLYARIDPYIQLESPQNNIKNKDKSQPFQKEYQENQPKKKEYSELTIFDLNTADTTQLKKIKGIGTAFAKRIVKYRDLLGGFHDANQLKEVYGLAPEVADEVLKYGKVQSPVRKINVNSATENELGKHPYIKYKLAKIIINYRNQHGNFNSADDLLKIKLLEKETFDKMIPYLVF